MSWIRRNLKIVLPVAAVALVGVAVLAFGVFGVHTLFIDDKVDEAGPVFDSGTTASDVAADEPATTDVPLSTEATEVQETSDEAPAAPPVATVPPVTAPPTPQIVTIADGSFIPRGRYSGEGDALVLNDGSAQRFLRFENFSTDNGPDLRVYLSASDANGDSGAFDDDFIDLGVLKGNIGDQNYEIPPEVDLSVYDTVVVWCVRFSTPFTAADLVAA
ncbi:MAG TPA: DM13 domain-containing protein [Ilumatobacteraceae bacterium]|nr:DM13 domain-containing protein [Ilumatobacteraceae bacterium]